MRFDILTLFPGMFDGPLAHSIVARAIKSGVLEIALHNIRDHAISKHRTVDDYPYGGGAGMVMQPGPLFAAVEALVLPPGTPVILLTPQGKRFTQAEAGRLAQLPRIALLCGHYEGVDERVRTALATEELSVGDYVLSGGELPALIVVDAVTRLLPGAIAEASTTEESHTGGLLEYPHYTRPPVFRGMIVPEVLLSGHHGAVARWRREQALRRTFERRPDLLGTAEVSKDERLLIERWQHVTSAGDDPAAV